MDFETDSEPDPFPDSLPPVEEAKDARLTSGVADQFAAGTPSAALESDPASPANTEGSVTLTNQFWRLDEQNIQVERIASLIFAAILLTVALVALLIMFLSMGFAWMWIVVAGISTLIVVLSFVFAVIWPPLSHHNTSWRLDSEGLEIHHGVLWKHRVIVPLGRVQHADVSQGPLQRPFGVGTLTIHTAGTQHASIPLAGLTHETAIQLRDLIVHQKKDQHVV